MQPQPLWGLQSSIRREPGCELTAPNAQVQVRRVVTLEESGVPCEQPLHEACEMGNVEQLARARLARSCDSSRRVVVSRFAFAARRQSAIGSAGVYTGPHSFVAYFFSAYARFSSGAAPCAGFGGAFA